LILAAAEELMRDEGYAAVTSRKLAVRAGVKAQIIHYYFGSMDDLFVALLRQLNARMFEQQEEVLQSENPLEALWKLTSDPQGTLLNYEIVALANHRKAVRADLAALAEQFLQKQTQLLGTILERAGIEFPWENTFSAFMLTWLARGHALEQALGISYGRQDVDETIGRFLKTFAGKMEAKND
jgi:AcrR family transcriptional regulator